MFHLSVSRFYFRKIHLSSNIYCPNAPGAVEGGDGIPVVPRMIEELDNIVSSDNTDGNIAGRGHFRKLGGM